jgi:uncharacterized membrane protein YbhN (UPF0104 family)
VLAALLLSVLQVVLSAWRWRYTARRVGLELPLEAAVVEYYLATFLNQVLPGGVMGDVTRAWRHARDAGPAARPPSPGVGVEAAGSGARVPGADGRTVTARTVHAVVVERAAGQVVMGGVALVSAALLVARSTGGGVAVAGVLATLAAGGAGLRAALRRRARTARSGAFLHSLDRALLAPGPLRIQLLTSGAVVASYVATYLLAAGALGVQTGLLSLVPLVAPVLVTMLLPVTVAGWGLREAAAAALWGSVGLAPADGVAISVTYGLLVLLGSLPGAVVVAFRRRRGTDPGRRRDPSPGGRAAPAGDGPPPASRSLPG